MPKGRLLGFALAPTTALLPWSRGGGEIADPEGGVCGDSPHPNPLPEGEGTMTLIPALQDRNREETSRADEGVS